MRKQLLFFIMMLITSITLQATPSYPTRSGAEPNKPQTTIQKSIATTHTSTLLSEGFDSGVIPTNWSLIDADNDGNNWKITYASGNYYVYSESYDLTEGVYTPDNWLITPSLVIPNNISCSLTYNVMATYKNYVFEHYAIYVIANNDTSEAIFEETLQNDDYLTRYVDLSSYAGQTIQIAFRHYNCTDYFQIMLDNISVISASNSDIISTDTILIESETYSYTMESVYFMNNTSTDSVTITATFPFEVSTNGTYFSSSIKTVPAAESFYIRAYSTTGGIVNGTLTAIGGSYNQTLVLQANFLDCSQALISDYTETFAPSSTNLSCWSPLDMNNDNNTFFYYSNEINGFIYEYSTINAANDYLLSPTFAIDPTDTLFLTYFIADYDYPESFSIYIVSPLYANLLNIEANKTLIGGPYNYVTNTDDSTIVIPMLNYANQNVRFAIHCHSDADMYEFIINGFELRGSRTTVDTKPVMNQEQLLYPNPVRDVLYFTEAAERVMVYTTSGQLLYQGSLNETEQSVNVSFLPQGLYMVRLMNKESVSTHLIIKE